MGRLAESSQIWLHAIAPFWGLVLVGVTLVSALLPVPWLAVFAHMAALTCVFHLWHIALHDRRSGPLYRQHQRHHATHSGRHFLAARYHSEGGVLQELSLLFAAAILAAISALLGASAPMLITCALASVALIVAGGALHRAMHVADHPLGRFRWFCLLRRLHVGHHIDPSSNLGIIECGLDALKGSLRTPGHLRADESCRDPRAACAEAVQRPAAARGT
jgi:sterol desaturase/sphingolipid hydroxylase (fatty acid hydroxylase superfamily)